MKIKLYTGPNCLACKALKGRLKLLGLGDDYTECNTGEAEHREAIMALGFRSIPVLVSYNDNGVMMDTLAGNLAKDSDYEEFFKGGYA